MRYWILTALLNVMFYMIILLCAPELLGSGFYYVGIVILTLIALVITWRDPPDMLEKVLRFLIKWGTLCAGVAFALWGIGYKLHLWGDYNSNGDFISIFDMAIPNLAILTGIAMLVAVYFHYQRR